MNPRMKHILRPAAVLAASVMLLAPAFMHGAPFIFLDTQHYFLIGKRIIETLLHVLHLDGAVGEAAVPSGAISNAGAGAAPADDAGGGLAALAGGRSPIYSVFLFVVSTMAGMWIAAWLQALVCAALVFRFCRLMFGEQVLVPLGLNALMALFSSLGFHAAFMMPDVFAGCLCLALALILFSPRLGWREGAVLSLAGFVFATMHASNILLTASAIVIGALIQLIARAPLRPMIGRFALLSGIVGASLAFSSFYVVAVRIATGDEVRSIPYLTARVIGDGAGERYLADVCSPVSKPFAACIFAGKDFASQDDFLSEKSSGGYYTASPAERVRLSNEDTAFALSAALHDPLGQAGASLANFAQALVSVGIFEVTYGVNAFADLPDWRGSEVLPYVPGGPACLADRALCGPAPWTGDWQLIVVVLGLASLLLAPLGLLLAAAGSRPAPGHTPEAAPALCAAAVLVGLVLANAAVCGVLSGVHDRYQSRLTWTLFLALAALWPALRVLSAQERGPLADLRRLTGRLQPGAADRRFFLASLGALGADLCLALLLRQGLGLSITLAAAISFVVVWLGAYCVHEYWTFRHARSRASASRLTRSLAASGAALACRVGIVFILERLHTPASALLAGVYVAAGAGGSFSANYLLNRFWVFDRSAG